MFQSSRFQWFFAVIVILAKRFFHALTGKRFRRPIVTHFADIIYRGANGEILEARYNVPNALADEGEKNILEQYYRAENAPTQFYARLYNDTPLETDGLADLTGEPSGNGYSAQLIERSSTGWPTLAQDAGDWQLTSKTLTFTASGGSIGPVTYLVIATTSDNTGLHIAFIALSQSRTLADGESLEVTIKPKQQ